MRSSFVIAATAAVLLIPSAAAFAQVESTWVTAVNDGVTLRACPGARCDVAGKLPAGLRVLVMREERGWYWVDVPKEHQVLGKIQNTWVRAEDVRTAAATAHEARASKATAQWKEPVVAPSEATAPANPAVAAPGPTPSASACLTCAAPQKVTSSVMLTQYGSSAGGGPGRGDPAFDANVELGQKKFGGRLREAQKQADLTRTKVSTYIWRCYAKYAKYDERPGRPVARPKSGARRWTVNWGMLASPTSPYTWNDGWVANGEATVPIRRYCGTLWLGIHKEASDLQGIASDITTSAIAEKIYPEAIHRLLVSYNLK